MSSEKIKNDIPLAALGRLSKAEALELEAAIAEDPQLAAELREHEEIIAGLWHSAAPLQTMPRSAWGELQERLHKSKMDTPETSPHFSKWLGALGWAAALVLGIFLWTGEKSTPRESSQAIEPGEGKTITKTRIIDSNPGATEAERAVRERLRKVQEKLTTALAERDSATLASQVIELYPPGESPVDSPEVRSQRLLKLLTEALGHNLQKLDEESVSLIIEEGWLNIALQSLPADATIRHRAFPIENFDDYELLRSPEGEFFDPSSNFIWKPAPDGGGYLGSLAPEDMDLSNFTNTPEIKEVEDPAPTDTRLADLPQPSGYLVRNEHGDAPSFVLSGVNPTTDAITIRQGSQTVGLEHPLLTFNASSAPLSATGNNIQGSSSISGPQLLEISDFNNSHIIWSEPFEVIRTNAQGKPSVILTTEP